MELWPRPGNTGKHYRWLAWNQLQQLQDGKQASWDTNTSKTPLFCKPLAPIESSPKIGLKQVQFWQVSLSGCKYIKIWDFCNGSYFSQLKEDEEDGSIKSTNYGMCPLYFFPIFYQCRANSSGHPSKSPLRVTRCAA